LHGKHLTLERPFWVPVLPTVLLELELRYKLPKRFDITIYDLASTMADEKRVVNIVKDCKDGKELAVLSSVRVGFRPVDDKRPQQAETDVLPLLTAKGVFIVLVPKTDQDVLPRCLIQASATPSPNCFDLKGFFLPCDETPSSLPRLRLRHGAKVLYLKVRVLGMD